MNMRKIGYLISLIACFLLICSFPIAEVSAAYSYTDILAYQSRGYPDLSYCIHANTGKLVKVSMDNNNIYVHVVSSSGSLLATVTVDVTISAAYNAQYSTVKTLNSTSVIIFTTVEWHYWPSDHKGRIYLYATNLNLISYTAVSYNVMIYDTDSAQGFSLYATLSRIFKYGTNFYAAIIYSVDKASTPSDQLRRCMVKYNPSTHALNAYDDEQLDTVSGFNPNILGFQDFDLDVSGRYVYLIYAKAGALTTAISACMDMDSNLITDIATYPTSGHYSVSRMIQFVGGGTYVDGSDVYLYFTYVYPEIVTGVAYDNFIQYRLRFNCTNLTAANLQEQGYRYRHALVSSSDATELWIWGYCEDKSTIYYYYIYRSPSTGIYTIGERRLAITTFTDMGSQIWDTLETISDTLDSFPYDVKTDVVGRDPYGTYSVSEDGTNIRVFYGLGAFEGEYDITLSYLPADTPLISEKTYTFTGTGYVNSIGVKHYQVWFKDGTQIAASATSASGVLTVTLSTNAGIHNISISMYSLDGSTYYYTESFLYSWQQAAAPAPGEPSGITISNVIGLIAYGLPAMFVVMIPIIAFSRIKDLPPLVSIISGLVVGIVVGTVSGIFPVYLTFLFILGIAIIFVYMMQR